MKYVFEIQVHKGDGMQGLLGSLSWCAAIAGVRALPGEYEVTIERKSKRRIRKEKAEKANEEAKEAEEAKR